MIGQYLPQTNESATVAKSKIFSHPNKASVQISKAKQNLKATNLGAGTGGVSEPQSRAGEPGESVRATGVFLLSGLRDRARLPSVGSGSAPRKSAGTWPSSLTRLGVNSSPAWMSE